MITQRNIRPQYTIYSEIQNDKNETYDISDKIKDILIVNTIHTIYPLIFITIWSNSKLYFMNEMFGTGNILLAITLTPDGQMIAEETVMDLTVLHVSTPMSIKNDNKKDDGGEMASEIITFVCIPQYAFNLMSTNVNEIFKTNDKFTGRPPRLYENAIIKQSSNNNPLIPSGQTSSFNNQTGNNNNPINAIYKIVNKYLKDYNTFILSTNHNDVEIGDFAIWPMSFNSAIKQIDEYFSIYDGPLHSYVGIDNVYYMWDLKTQINKPALYTIDILSKGAADYSIYDDFIETGTRFYTHSTLNTHNASNSKSIYHGEENIFVKKPIDKFFDKSITMLDDVARMFGAGDNRKKDIVRNKKIKTKNVHSNNFSGNRLNDSFINSKFGKFISSSSKCDFYINGYNMRLNRLFHIGVPIEIIPHVTEYLPYGGKYLVESSTILLSRDSNFIYEPDIRISCMRENLHI